MSITFYQLTRKIINNQEGIPENARQVMYYSLAIGHHVGVMDCLSVLLEIPPEAYRQWVARLPEGAGRSKLEGVLRWGEIEINRGHAGNLASALRPALPTMSAVEAQWANTLLQCLKKMVEEPALYLMVRNRT